MTLPPPSLIEEAGSPGLTGSAPASSRERLLAAAIGLFGERGLEGTSTRAVAAEAGVNMQSIGYHFGHKSGLYQAAAVRVAQRLAQRTAPTRREIAKRMLELGDTGQNMSPDEAREHLLEIVDRMAMVFTDDDTKMLSLFVIREQMTPTPVFETIHEILLLPVLDVMATLTARVLDETEVTEPVRLRVLSLLGSVIVFRVVHGGAMAHLGWDGMTEARRDAVRGHVASLLDDLGRGQTGAGSLR